MIKLEEPIPFLKSLIEKVQNLRREDSKHLDLKMTSPWTKKYASLLSRFVRYRPACLATWIECDLRWHCPHESRILNHKKSEYLNSWGQPHLRSYLIQVARCAVGIRIYQLHREAYFLGSSWNYFWTPVFWVFPSKILDLLSEVFLKMNGLTHFEIMA